MSTLKPSGRIFVEKRPVAMLYVAKKLPGSFSGPEFILEEVLDGLWNSPASEVKNHCIEMLTKYRFASTSNLSTRAHLRDTILHDDNTLGGEKVYERLFLLYLRYSSFWWVYSAQQPVGASEKHVVCRRKRVITTAYGFLSKLYCRGYEGADGLRQFVGCTPIRAAFLRHLVEQQRIRSLDRLTPEESELSAKMLGHYASSFKSATKKDPLKVDEGFDRELALIARFVDATRFWNVDVEQAFKRFGLSVQQDRIIPQSQYEWTSAECDIAKRRLLAGIEVVCETLKQNRALTARKSKQVHPEGGGTGQGDCGVA